MWIAHLQRIADFLACGEGVWWEKEKNAIIFKDGDDEDDERDKGPSLLHFSTTQIHEVCQYIIYIISQS